MRCKPATPEAYRLLHEGVLALSQMEANGIRIDESYLRKAMTRTEKQIRRLETSLREDDVYKRMRKRYGSKTNLDSRPQLARIVFGELGYTARETTELRGDAKADESAFEAVDLQFVKDYFKRAKLKKLLGTYLTGILRESCNGFIHPVFNLHLVSTYRSSSDNPNFQNFPIRDPEAGKLIRSAFIPRPGRVIVEIDEGGIEVRSIACYNHDPVLIDYINNSPPKDMHRDMAAQCFKLKAEQVNKQSRYCGKNMFVFPQFYGDWYIDCARVLWEAMDRMSLVVEGTDLPMRRHLKRKGITELGDCDPKEKPREGTFEKHIKEVEYDFWNRRFKVYGRWKKKWWEAYQVTGGFDTLTGFRFQGVMRKNVVLNSANQGTAFHILLWALIQIQKKIRKRKMKTLLVGQIHDSLIADVPVEELQDYLELAIYYMTEGVRKHWPWIIVPLEVEAEVTPEGGTWHDKKKIELPK